MAKVHEKLGKAPTRLLESGDARKLQHLCAKTRSRTRPQASEQLPTPLQRSAHKHCESTQLAASAADELERR
eukprot:3476430-Rhodomonas_salina.1